MIKVFLLHLVVASSMGQTIYTLLQKKKYKFLQTFTNMYVFIQKFLSVMFNLIHVLFCDGR
jgi:hypothetical protein